MSENGEGDGGGRGGGQSPLRVRQKGRGGDDHEIFFSVDQ